MKKTITEIEAAIEKRIAEESETYELDHWDIAEIREEAYKAGGWAFDPFAEELEDEDEDEPEFLTALDYYRLYGLSPADFH